MFMPLFQHAAPPASTGPRRWPQKAGPALSARDDKTVAARSRSRATTALFRVCPDRGTAVHYGSRAGSHRWAALAELTAPIYHNMPLRPVNGAAVTDLPLQQAPDAATFIRPQDGHD